MTPKVANNAARPSNEANSGESKRSPQTCKTCQPTTEVSSAIFNINPHMTCIPPPPLACLICHRALYDLMEGRTLTNVLLFAPRPSAVRPTLRVFCVCASSHVKAARPRESQPIRPPLAHARHGRFAARPELASKRALAVTQSRPSRALCHCDRIGQAQPAQKQARWISLACFSLALKQRRAENSSVVKPIMPCFPRIALRLCASDALAVGIPIQASGLLATIPLLVLLPSQIAKL